MNASYFKMAIWLVGFSVSLTCSAADETTTNQGGSPVPASLPSPFDPHMPASDGREKFSELFHLDDDSKISYQETFDHPPNPALADAMDKQWADVVDPPGIKRKATLEAYSQSIRQGSRAVFFYTFYVSKKSKLMVEKMEDDQSMKGYVIDTSFTGATITEVEPSAGIATLFPPDAMRYMELLINFPALHGALGFFPEKLQMTAKPPMFVIGKTNLPVSFLLKLDSRQSLIETDEVVFPHRVLSVSKFQYSTQSRLWPARVDTEVFANDGTSQGHGRWDLLKIEKLPDGFDFSPKIEANYRIVNKTSPQ